MANLEILHFKEVGSTQTYAKKLIANNEIEKDTLILADVQTHGKGRLNTHIWISKLGNFHGSFILNLKGILQENNISLLNPIIMQAVLNTLHKILNNVTLKLPNDICVNNKKISGVLVEVFYPYAVVGIGINLIEAPLPSATSVYIECNKKILNTDIDFINGLYFNIIKGINISNH